MISPNKSQLPDEVYIPLVGSLFAEARSLLIGSLIVVTAMAVCFIKTNQWPFYALALTFLALSTIRLFSIAVFNRSQRLSRGTAERWEVFYVAGASIAVAILGIWCWLAFALTDDSVVQLMSFSLTIGYLIGVYGRNFGNSKYVALQALCAWLPMTGALLIHGGPYHWFFAGLLAPLFLGIGFIATRLRSILLDAIAEKLNAEAALDTAKREAESAEKARQRTHTLLVRLRQSKKSEEAAIATRDAHLRFLAKMSHEIRTPLNGIIGALDLIGTSTAEKAPALIKTATSSADTLLEIVSEVLDLAKLEYGDTTSRIKPFNAKQLVETVCVALEPIALGKGLDLRMAVDADVPEIVLGDPGRVRQVLLNLVGNALKFTETGFIELALRLRSVDDSRAVIDFQVRDTGSGISSADIKDIYEPFFTRTEGYADDTHSSGLGLAIVKQAIEQMGYTITCESVVGVGTTFTVQTYLPIAHGASVEAESKPLEESHSNTDPARVLLVEDNETNALIVADMLEETHHSVERARGGLEAVRMATEQDYDLILMDISMPDIDGIEACRRIRKTTNKGFERKIIALTANAVVGDRERFLSSGFDAYLSKPIRKVALVNAINANLSGKEQSSRLATKSSMRELPAFDEVEFAEFLDDRSQVRAIQLLQIFEEELAKHSAKLKGAYINNQTNLAERTSHTIVGMSGSVGAKKLSALASRFETTCRSGELPTSAELASLQSEISRVLDESAHAIATLQRKAA